jgi:hypothetical protein
MALGSTQSLIETNTRNLLEVKGRPVYKADNLAAIYESIAYKVQKPWPVTHLRSLGPVTEIALTVNLRV